MILADTSIWIDHMVREDRNLRRLLDGDRIIMHPVIIGELALGNWSRRREVLTELHQLP